MFTCVVFGSLVAVSVISGGLALTEEEREIVLSAHNQYRSILAKGQAENPNGTFLPPGSSIYALKYNPEIEAMAQDWADRCVFKHTTSEQRKGTGESMYNYGDYRINNTYALKDAADKWWDELAEHGFYSKDQILTDADFDATIGHWSQLVWEKTQEIGCGIAHCSTNDSCGIMGCGGMTFVVCNYYPPGNWNYHTERVYTSGDPCTETSGCVNTPASTCNTSSNLCEESGGLEFPPVLTTIAPGKCTAQLKSCTRSSCNCGCTINGGVNTDTSNSTCKAWVTKCTDNSCACNCSTG